MLGPLEVRGEGGPIELGRGRPRRLLIALLLRGRPGRLCRCVDRSGLGRATSGGRGERVADPGVDLGNEEVTTDLTLLAETAAARADWSRAARLLGAAAGFMEATGDVLEPVFRARFERTADEVRAVLGDVEFDAAWKAGGAAPQKVIAEATTLATDNVQAVIDHIASGRPAARALTSVGGRRATAASKPTDRQVRDRGAAALAGSTPRHRTPRNRSVAAERSRPMSPLIAIELTRIEHEIRTRTRRRPPAPSRGRARPRPRRAG